MTTMHSDVDADEAFGLLHEISQLTQDDLIKILTPRHVILIRWLYKDLSGEDVYIDLNNSSGLIQIINRMSELEAYWSKKMGQTFLEAYEYRDCGNTSAARSVISSFIDQCFSNSYRDIAKIELENYTN